LRYQIVRYFSICAKFGYKINPKILTRPSSHKFAPVYFENLDALRFIAAFSVFVFHFFRDIRGFYPELQKNGLFDALLIVADKGGLGVNFFFVLSGFLITYLILDEKRRTGHFSLWRFLVRRTLRIWPVYFMIVGIGFVLFPLILEGYETVHRPVYYVFFLANFDELNAGAQDTINFLTAPWSVAVEEQFYLFWSLALFPLLKLARPRIEILILALTLFCLYFRWANIENERVIYFHTFSVCQDLLTGCFIGLSLYRQKSWITAVVELRRWIIVLIYLLGLLIVLAKNKLFAGDLHVFERLVISIFFGFVILDQALGRHSIFKVGKIKVLNYLGKISYGFYMYHLVVMYLLTRAIGEWTAYGLIPVYFIASLAGTIFTAMLSYHLIESQFLKLKPAPKSLS
jgi:peptidoglycan/LPS O-acetylase OafA/YrhL